MQLSSDGTASRLAFSGSSSQVLTGAGTFTTLSSLSGWTVSGSTNTTNNKVGIGVTPNQAFECLGNGIFSGYVAAQQFLVADIATVQGRLTLTNNLMMDGYDPIAGTRNELYTTTQPYYIQSAPGYNKNVIMAFGNESKIGIGTNNPSTKLEVNGDFKVSGNSYSPGKAHFNKITAMPGDSLIHFGDSSMIMNTVNHRIYANPYMAPVTLPGGGAVYQYIGGIGIGGDNGTAGATRGNAEYSIAMGFGAIGGAKKSIAIGRYVSTTAPFMAGDYNNIVLGSGISNSQRLVNNVANSLMIGFNSNIPTFFVSASSGAGTTGKVGIGTTYIPTEYKFAVNGKIIAEELQVQLRGDWPDYVLTPGYDLPSLQSLKQYINENTHLPNVPDAEEVKEKGIATGEMLRIQMEKIEELTLYIIEQDKKIMELEKSIIGLMNK